MSWTHCRIARIRLKPGVSLWYDGARQPYLFAEGRFYCIPQRPLPTITWNPDDLVDQIEVPGCPQSN